MKRQYRLALSLLVALVLLNLSLPTSNVAACSPVAYAPATLAERTEAADFVFEGAADFSEPTLHYRYPYTATLTVYHWYKGEGPAQITVDGFGVGGDCLDELPPGRAIFFATGVPNKSLSLNYIGVYDTVEAPYPPYIAQILETTGRDPTSPLSPSSAESEIPPHDATQLSPASAGTPPGAAAPPSSAETNAPSRDTAQWGRVLLLAAVVLLLVEWLIRRQRIQITWRPLLVGQRRWLWLALPLLAVPLLLAGLAWYFSEEPTKSTLPADPTQPAEPITGLPLCAPDCYNADLRQANLSELDLRGILFGRANLQQANLSDSDLRGVYLYNANLSESNLINADLSGADLHEADLRGADLSGATLHQTDLSNALIDETTQLDDHWRSLWALTSQDIISQDLSTADLHGANFFVHVFTDTTFHKANLAGANLRGVQFDTTDLSQANLTGADLAGGFLTAANLSQANLTGASLRSVRLAGTDLSGANLREADLRDIHASPYYSSVAMTSTVPYMLNLQDADLQGADLRGVDLRTLQIQDTTILDEKWATVWQIISQPQTGRDLPQADLREANLEGAQLAGANLQNADLFGANLTAADLSGANLQGANLRGAILTGVNLSGANLRGADLRWVDLRRANLENVATDGATLWDEKWQLAWQITNNPQSGRQLQGVDLSWTDLSAAQLENANLNGANLSHTLLDRANLSEATLIDADLTEASLRETDCRQANLTHAILLGASLNSTNCQEANFTQATLFEATLYETNLYGANFREADLQWAFFTDADLRTANLHGANLSNVRWYVLYSEETDIEVLLTGARYDDQTVWPEPFDPAAWALIKE